MISNLAQYPQAAERYSQKGGSLGKTGLNKNGDGEEQKDDEAAGDPFHYENPDMTDIEQLKPTSVRKKWMLRHGKRIKKKVKADKTGYIGS